MNFIATNRLMSINEGNFDGHAHVFRHDLPMVADRRYAPDYVASLNDYAALLMANSLDGGLLVQPSFLGSDNSFLIESLQRTGEFPRLQFKGVAVVEPHTSKVELKKFDETGIVGLRLNILGQEDIFDLVPWQPVLREADRLGWHVELHARGYYLPNILPQLLSTNQTVVVDHFGLPDISMGYKGNGLDAIFDAPAGQVLVKVSAPYRVCQNDTGDGWSTVSQPWFNRLVAEIGPDNLVWGSDWPHTQHERQFCFAQSLKCRNDWIAANDW